MKIFLTNDINYIHRSENGCWLLGESVKLKGLTTKNLAGCGYYYSPHCDKYKPETITAVVRVMAMLGLFPNNITNVFIISDSDAVATLNAAGVRCVWDGNKPGECVNIPDGAVTVEAHPVFDAMNKKVPRLVADVDVLGEAGYNLRGGVLDYYIYYYLQSHTNFQNIPSLKTPSITEDEYSILACSYKDYSDVLRFGYGNCKETMQLIYDYNSSLVFTGDKFIEYTRTLGEEIYGMCRLWNEALFRVNLTIGACENLEQLEKQIGLLRKITPIECWLEAFYIHNISVDDILGCVPHR